MSKPEKFTGIKLDFGPDGSVKIKQGKKILPHRIELIEREYNKQNYKRVLEMLYNYTIKNCHHGTDLKQLEREDRIYNNIIRLSEAKGFANDAA
jgi:hypothetical protein